MEQIFLESVIKRLAEYKALGDKTFLQLNEQELNISPAPGSNSIAVIVRHLHGNMLSRWTDFLTEDGEKPWRSRDAEFESAHAPKEHLIALWEEGWTVFLNTLHALKPTDLQRTVTIRREPHPVVDAILRQMAHYCGHIGQIVYAGKMLKGGSWESLSIPRGGSDSFNHQMRQQHGQPQ